MNRNATMRRRRRDGMRPILTMLCLLPLATTLVGCADDTPPQSFAPLDFAYLGQLHLNVGRVDIVDLAPAGSTPGDISAQAPTPADQALQTMARERLVAAGSAGSATFTITRAAISRAADDTLHGDLAVHIDILTTDGQHAGYAEAQVSRSLNSGDQTGGALRGTLYALTSQMMQDMNVELEFQVRRSLKDWLSDAGGAPAPGAIQQQPLSAPGAPAAAPSVQSAPAAPVPSATPSASDVPDAIFPTGGEITPAAAALPPPHSPQPGYLQLPGAAPAGQP